MADRLFAAAAAILALTLSACAGFGDFQSARMAGPGNTQVTPTAAATWLAADDHTERVTHNVGLRLTHGVTPALDVIGGVEYVGFRDRGRGSWAVGAGPKLSLVQDRLALWLPVGALFGEDVETARTWQTNPTLLFSFDLSPEVEITPSAKALIPLHPDQREEGNYLLGLNLGLGWTPPGAAWTLRPEGGLIWDPNASEQGRMWHLGVGATIPVGR
jgi:hypothetical protein